MLAVSACEAAPGEGALPGLDQEFVRAAYAHEPPFAFLDSTGAVTGESPIALDGAVDALGVDSVRWVRMTFDELLPALEQGRVDVVASGLFPTAERRARVLFTRPTSCSGPALAVRDEEVAPESLQALARAEDLRLAVVRGAVEARAAAALGITPDRILLVDEPSAGLEALRAGRVDALALTEPTLRRTLAGEPALRVEPYAPSPTVTGMVSGCSALAVRRDASALAEALDRGLEAYIGSEAHRARVEPFGFRVPDAVTHSPHSEGPP